MPTALAAYGQTLTDHDGGRLQLAAASLQRHGAEPSDLAANGAPLLVPLCVKSGATATTATAAGTRVLSMQNGIGSAAIAQAASPRLTVLPGTVPFNVAEAGAGKLHRGTNGQLAAQDHPALRPWLPLLAAGLPLALRADLAAVQWGKLPLNLNTAVNALSGLPLRAQLLDRDLRCCTAALVTETPAVRRYRAGGDVAAAAGRAARGAAPAHAAVSVGGRPHAQDRQPGPVEQGRRSGAGPAHRGRGNQRRGNAPARALRHPGALQHPHHRLAARLATAAAAGDGCGAAPHPGFVMLAITATTATVPRAACRVCRDR